jgi:hypothetical protein
VSHPFRWRLVAIAGRRAALLVSILCVVGIVSSSSGQSREVLDAVREGGNTLSKADNSNLLGIIAIVSMCLAAFFGWMEKSVLQVIRSDVAEIKTHISRMRCAAPKDCEK